MSAFRTGRNGRYHVGVKKQEQPGRAEVLTCAVLDLRAEKRAPIPKNGPKGFTQKCWADQSEEGDMLHDRRGKRKLSATTENMIRENLRNKK